MPAMVAITRKLEFDYGHRVLLHESKCKHLHGHRGVVEVTIQAPELDPLGRVVDFGCVKELVGGWVDRVWDHNMILHPDDPLVVMWRFRETMNDLINYNTSFRDIRFDVEAVFGGKAPYVMPPGQNPTAENLAQELFREASQLLGPPLQLTKVKFYETPKCSAEFPVVGMTWESSLSQEDLLQLGRELMSDPSVRGMMRGNRLMTHHEMMAVLVAANPPLGSPHL